MPFTHKRLFILCMLCLQSIQFSLLAQPTEKSSAWHGFEKVAFKLNGVPAYYIKPEKPLPGNPWVWRARFPDWHIEIDSILLQRGFHVAYINTNDLFGHAKAMIIWDEFYQYLVTQKQFAPKVALEGVSRGGLYVYGWAKCNPDKVTCIYAEAPVCDFNSWPGGKGRGTGSPDDWNKLLQVYGFTEAQALQYADQPKDNLKGLASFKVPILHVVSMNDSIVPVEENTQVLANNYLKLGGPVSIYPMTRGKQTLQGHHFPIENPEVFVDFIYNNSMPVKHPLAHKEFIHSYGSLANILTRIKAGKEATVAFLGGSITYNPGWREKTSQYLQELFPETTFTFINAGIPSLGSLPHAFRLQRDVLDKGRIDLLFVESAVNDYANATPEVIQRRALEGIMRHAFTANPNMNVVLMAFADEFKLADYAAGKVPQEVKVHQDIAAAYKIPFINLAEEVYKRIKVGEFTWEYDFKDLHPSPFGQEIYFQTIKELLRTSLLDKSAGKMTAIKLPKPLHTSNFDKGKYVSIEAARHKDGFSIDPSWQPKDSIPTRAGYVELPMLVAEKAGASFELPFTGRAVGIAVAAGPDAGILQYSIDGKPEQTIDLFTQWSSVLHIPWYHLLDDQFPAGKHVLKVRVSSERHPKSIGNACRIVHFLVNE